MNDDSYPKNIAEKNAYIVILYTKSICVIRAPLAWNLVCK